MVLDPPKTPWNIALKVSDIETFAADKHWNPRIFIQNSVGDLKENTWHKVEIDAVGEKRGNDVGNFLYHFLTIGFSQKGGGKGSGNYKMLS
jgi:hypothetical protein